MKPTPSLGTLYHLVAEDERQRSIYNEKKPLQSPQHLGPLKEEMKVSTLQEKRIFRNQTKKIKRRKKTSSAPFAERGGINEKGALNSLGTRIDGLGRKG